MKITPNQKILKEGNKTKNGGFTLIELIVSIAMMLIVTSAAVQVSRVSDTHKGLTLASSELTAAIRTAQGQALSASGGGEHICGYGVHIGDDGKNYEIFYTFADADDFRDDPDVCEQLEFHSYVSGNKETEKELSLSKKIEFSEGTRDTEVFFVSPYGEVVNAVTFTLSIEEGQGSSGSKSVLINEHGKVSF